MVVEDMRTREFCYPGALYSRCSCIPYKRSPNLPHPKSLMHPVISNTSELGPRAISARERSRPAGVVGPREKSARGRSRSANAEQA